MSTAIHKQTSMMESSSSSSSDRPSYKFYDKLEDMLYDSENEEFNADMSKFPTPPI